MAQVRKNCVVWISTILLGCSTVAHAQSGSEAIVPDRVVCPGDPAGNLASADCNFSKGLRFEQFAAAGLTDQALAGAALFATFSQLRGSVPTEWSQWSDWRKRVGTNYAQNLAKSATVYGIGALVQDDPRHIRCDADKRSATSHCSGAQRVGHVVLDWAMVRRSTHDGNGRRMPNLGLLGGTAVSAMVGNIWYPPSGKTSTEVAWRAAGSLGTALAASAWTEFSPDIGRGVGALFEALFRTRTGPTIKVKP